MSESAFDGFMKALGEFSKDPTVKREGIKTGFKVAGGVLTGLGSLWLWDKKRKKRKQDEAEAEAAKKKAKDQDRQDELEHARELERIKTEGARERMNLRGHKDGGTASSTRPTPSKPLTDVLTETEERDFEPQDYGIIVPKLIFEGEFVGIAGDSGLGKSYLAVQLFMNAVVGGESSFLLESEEDVAKCYSYYYATEGSKDKLRKRFPDGFLEAHRKTCQLFYVDNRPETDVLGDIDNRIETSPIGRHLFFIIDNLSSLVDDQIKSNRAKEVVKRCFNAVRNAENKGVVCTIVLFTHTTGSGAKTDTVATLKKDARTTLLFSQDSNDVNQRILSIEKTNDPHKDKTIEYVFRFVGDEGDCSHLEFVRKQEKGADSTSFKAKTASVISPLKSSSQPTKEQPAVKPKTTSTPTTKKDVRCKFSDEDIKEIIRRKNAGERIEDIAKEKGTSMKTLYKWINKYREEHPDE